MHRVDDEAGITLVEIMVSLLVLGLVLTAFFRVVTGGLESLSESRARQTTSQVSTEIIEELRRLSPSEIALRDDPAVEGEPGEIKATSFECLGTAGEFDPDGPGPLGCEVVVSNSQGAIVSDVDAPFQRVVDAVTVVTVPTLADTSTGIPDDTVRVTVVMEYELGGDAEVVRRSALFSEVSRG